MENLKRSPEVVVEETHLVKDVRHYENCVAWLTLQCLPDKSRLKQAEFKPAWFVFMDVSYGQKLGQNIII